MIKAFIIEDEEYTLLEITEILQDTGSIRVCGAYQSPIEALEKYENQRPQVIFVDIEMPDMDGLTLAELLMNKNPLLKVVFITAYNHYAVQAFDINALDYILKPIDPERCEIMIKRLVKAIELESTTHSSLEVKCFGDFEVNVYNIPVKWERSKAEELFAYFLANYNKKIHKEVIIENLWSDYKLSKALRILQTTVHKVRSVLAPYNEQLYIKFQDNSYILIIKDFMFDYKILMNLLAREDAVSFANIPNIMDTYESIKKGLFSDKGYLWSYEFEVKLKKLFYKKLKVLLMDQTMEKEVAEYIKNIIDEINVC